MSGPTPVLRLDVRRADRDLDVRLSLAPGEVVALLGPNGAGKSSVLSLVAGLLAPGGGRIELAGELVDDPAAGVRVPVHRRRAGLLAQDARLFPHLTLLENVAFGPRSAGVGRREAHRTARRRLAEVGLDGLGERRPAQVSGGQAQRAAVARALAADPRVLLLDEPLAALDVAAAPEVRHVLRRILRGDEGRAGLLVTHDPLDALALADRAVVLEAGRVVEEGPVTEVLSRPRSGFGARLAGLDLVRGAATEDGLVAPDGFRIAGRRDPDCPPGVEAVAIFAPSAVAVHVTDPGGSPRNRWPATVVELEPRGDVVRVRTRVLGHDVLADVTPAAAAALDLVPGAEVVVVVKATAVGVHAVGGDRAGASGSGT
ncbi:sulfate/molybdate ABC transporter ATP-binding protein [Kineococcus gynurae]|uniref:Sulfate/molybdate ABC transporter ATP-binding protein n=1 Tax=Kineococcus gynurae TaxID=452979 RepID=A0ABV5LS53_9ACTN